MADLRLEREFNVRPERLFQAITVRADLVRWWGPEGVHVPEDALDFTREGPWHSVMVGNDTGRRFKVSGHVTHVNPPRSVGFTWAWHDDEDKRGHESHVTLTVEETSAGARLVIDHRELDGGEMAANHKDGWQSTLNKMAKFFEEDPTGGNA